MKIVTIIGARPQFIKAATVSRAISVSGAIREVIVHTGQHYDANMSDVFFDQMQIPKPNYNLGVGGGSHGAMTGRQLEKIEEVLLQEKPEWVMVYGDTNSTLAGALAAVKLQIPVAHVEAGLRSFNRAMPEETNRVLTDHASSLLFAPTETAVTNLANEGISGEKVCLVGDVMYDAALFYRQMATKPVWFDEMGIPEDGFALCTIHRAENTADAAILQQILQGLHDSGMLVVLPLHPRTRAVMGRLGMQAPKNVHIVPPVGYLEMTWLEMHCRVVATDSGGVQKEAYFHQKPCITLRSETEWVELLSNGANVLVGQDAKKIAQELSAVRRVEAADLFGDGRAAYHLVSRLACGR